MKKLIFLFFVTLSAYSQDMYMLYQHPTSDGNKHVPATGTSNNGKFLQAGSTAGSFGWAFVAITNVTGLQAALDLKAPLANPTFTGTVSGITKAMVGLGSVDNTSDANKPVSSAQQTALNLKANLASPTFTGTVSGITKSMVGLGNVDNTSDANKPVSTAQQTALDLKAPLASPTFTGTATFTGTVAGITKAMVGLGNVDNTSDVNKPVSTAQQTALNLKANLASPTFTGTVSGITKSMVGLSNVDNTSDANKPVSSAQQDSLNTRLKLSGGTITGGLTLQSSLIATSINASAGIQSNNGFLSQGLTAYYNTQSQPDGLGRVGKFIWKLDGISNTDYTAAYRLEHSYKNDQFASATLYTPLRIIQNMVRVGGNTNPAQTLDVTGSFGVSGNIYTSGYTGYPYANGSGAWTASTTIPASDISGLTKSSVGLNNVDNTSDANKPVSTAQQTALNLKANLASPAFTGTVSGITKSMVGLSNVDNTSDANKPVSSAQQDSLNTRLKLSGGTITGGLTLQSSLIATSINASAGVQSNNGFLSQGLTAYYNTQSQPDGLGRVGKFIWKLDGISNTDYTAAYRLEHSYKNDQFASATLYTPLRIIQNMVRVGGNTNPVQTLDVTGTFGVSGNIYTAGYTGYPYANGSGAWTASTTIPSSAITGTFPSSAITGTFPATSITGLSKSSVGLANVDNTSDVNKPVSTAQQTALDAKLNLSGGTLTGQLLGTSLVFTDYLNIPIITASSNVSSNGGFTSQGTTANYTTQSQNDGLGRNTKYIWKLDALSNTDYAAAYRLENAQKTDQFAPATIYTPLRIYQNKVRVGGNTNPTETLDVTGSLGVSSTIVTPNYTGYPKANGSSAWTASATIPVSDISGLTKSSVGLANVDNTSDVNKPVSTAQQTALDAKLNLSGGTLTGQLLGTSLVFTDYLNIPVITASSNVSSNGGFTSQGTTANYTTQSQNDGLGRYTKYIWKLDALSNTDYAAAYRLENAQKTDQFASATIYTPLRMYQNKVRVGGNTNPTETLDVTGTLGVSGASTIGGNLNVTMSSTKKFEVNSTATVAYTDTFRLNQNVRVTSTGIGVNTVASYPLHASITGTSAIFGLTRASVGTFTNSITSAMTNSTADLAFDGAQANSGFIFRTRNSSNSSVNALGITRDGRVGVNTTNPAGTFEVNSGGFSSKLEGTSLSFTRNTGPSYILSDQSGGYLAFLTNGRPTSEANSNLVLKSNQDSYFPGSLSIGTSTVTEKLSVSGNIFSSGKSIYDATLTPSGTTGNQTINKPSGTVNFAPGATSLTVTNSFVTTSSIVTAIVTVNDATAYVKNVVPGSGTFTINLGAAATAETKVGFIVNN